METSVNTWIKRFYPADAEGDVGSIMKNWRTASGKTNDFRAEIVLLRLSAGQKDALEKAVTSALSSREQFREDVKLYWDWMLQENDYETGIDYLRFFSPWVWEIAKVAVPLGYHCSTSHMTLCIDKPSVTDWWGGVVFVVPLIEGALFVSQDYECRMQGKTRAISNVCKGVIVACPDIASELDSWLK